MYNDRIYNVALLLVTNILRLIFFPKHFSYLLNIVPNNAQDSRNLQILQLCMERKSTFVILLLCVL